MNKALEALDYIKAFGIPTVDEESDIIKQSIITALTQAAEIERGDKVVVDREPPSYSELLHKLNGLVEDFKSITASEGEDNE